MWLRYFFIIGIVLNFCNGAEESNETDSDSSRKILGSSVVTSVSVVMDTGNGKKTFYTDAVGKPLTKPSNPSELASPIDLLNPDRYEFYTFDDNGDLVKRLMSLEEIKSIIATGDSDAFDLDSFTSQGFLPEKRVSDVVSNVQSVLKEEMEILRDPITKPIFDTPDVSDSWSMILPAIFGNSGEDIKPEKPIAHVTPDTIMLEPSIQVSHTTPAPQKVDIILSSSTTVKNRPNPSSTHRPSISTTGSSFAKPIYYSSQALLTTERLSSTTEPSIKVEIFSNSMSTTDTNAANETLSDEERPLFKDEPLPTRAPNLQVARPFLIRNVTNTSDLHPASTTISTTSFATWQSLVELQPQSSVITSSSSRPTTVSIGTETLIQNDSLSHPTTLSSTSFKPISSLLTSTSHPTPQGSSSSISSPVSTSSDTSSSTVTTTFTSKLPVITSTLKIPLNHSTLVTATASKLTVKPQLTSSSTFSNLDATTSKMHTSASDITIAHVTSTVPITVTKTSEEISLPDLITKESVSIVSTRNPVQTSSEEMSTNKQPTWTPSVQDSELFKIFKETIAKGTTTEYITDVRPIAVNKIEEYDLEATTLKDVTTGSKMPSNEDVQSSNDDDLSTLPTELVDQKVITSSHKDNVNPTTLLPPLLQSLSDNQKISASELLDQLLLTTNIYEINTELAKTKLNTPDMDVRFDNSESILQPTSSDQKTSSLDQNSDQQTTTTDHDVISYPPTTDATLMQSIEQLLSQAVDDVGTVLNQTVGTSTIQEILKNSSNKNMTDFIKESATMASEITINENPTEAVQESTISTTEENHPESTVTSNDNLSGSVDTLLWQVNDDTASLNKIMITETPNISVTYRRVDNFENISTQSYVTNTEMSTEALNEDMAQLSENLPTKDREAEQETTTYYFVVKKESNKIPITDSSSNIINIPILGSELMRNRTKPAKADLSLEQELIAEELKNMSIVLNSATKNPLQLNDTFNESEANVSIVNSTIFDTNKNKDGTEDLTLINDLTTSHSNNEGSITTSEQNQPTEEYPSTTSEVDTTTNNLLFTDLTTQEATTLGRVIEEKTTIKTTTETAQKTRRPPKPSIVITVNANNTVVTENGKLVSNRTVSAPLVDSFKITEALKKENTTSTIQPLKFIEKNTTQDQTWTLVSTVAPQHSSSQHVPPLTLPYQEALNPPVHVDLVPKPMQGFGLEESTASLSTDVYQFAQLCNELAFGFWKTATAGLSSARSVFVSPFAAISMLAMVFLGAKGATSEEMNEILKLDDMVTFNPHLIFKNVSESVTDEPYSGVAVTTMIRELFSDRSKGKLLDFYKSRVKAFYDGYVEEVGYREIGDVIRRRTNLLIKKYSNGKYPEFLRDSSIKARPPLSGVSVNIFETDCSQTSTDGRDGELHFIVLPSIRQRRLVPIPAVVYRSGFLAGYEPSLDATAVSLGTKEQVVSTILVIPGQQGIAALGDGLARLEKRLVESSFKKGAWSRLLRCLIPRPGLEVQIPRFSHRSIINATNTLQRMGLHELFNPASADLRGLNGVANELHLSDVLQINSFATCGEKRMDGTHHSEIYPATTLRARTVRYLHDIPALDLDQEPRDYQRAFHDPLHDPSLLALPLSLRPRQARIPEIPRLRFDRPFLYFIRHNPTGLILHMGRFNPRLLP